MRYDHGGKEIFIHMMSDKGVMESFFVGTVGAPSLISSKLCGRTN